MARVTVEGVVCVGGLIAHAMQAGREAFPAVGCFSHALEKEPRQTRIRGPNSHPPPLGRMRILEPIPPSSSPGNLLTISNRCSTGGSGAAYMHHQYQSIVLLRKKTTSAREKQTYWASLLGRRDRLGAYSPALTEPDPTKHEALSSTLPDRLTTPRMMTVECSLVETASSMCRAKFGTVYMTAQIAMVPCPEPVDLQGAVSSVSALSAGRWGKQHQIQRGASFASVTVIESTSPSRKHGRAILTVIASDATLGSSCKVE